MTYYEYEGCIEKKEECSRGLLKEYQDYTTRAQSKIEGQSRALIASRVFTIMSIFGGVVNRRLLKQL